ncbi:MAG: cyclic pyranopterin monophosphate synthase MoaC [Anaerolineaceae bacterium]
MELTHLNKNGEVSMVDVSEKDITDRIAVAHAAVKMKENTLKLILAGEMQKGDVFACSRIAGIMAAKRTAELIPLCHPILLTHIAVDIQAKVPDRVEILATVKCTGITGVEMEAMCAASVAALTIYDMCKAVDREMEIVSVQLLEKDGGRSGHFTNQSAKKKHD